MPNLNIVVNSIPERPGEARGCRTEGDLQGRALSGADLAGPFEGHRWESKPPSRPPRNDAIGFNRTGLVRIRYIEIHNIIYI